MLKALKNHILFKFVDPVNAKGEFVRAQTDFGLQFLSTVDDSSKAPRWGEVISVGPDVENVSVGDFVLLPALRWTIGTKYEGLRFWRTDETEVVVVKRDEKFAVLNKFVVFKRIPAPKRNSALIIMNDIDEQTPSGIVQKIGKKVQAESLIQGTKIYFKGENFFDTTLPEDKVAPFQFSFIKEDDILVYELKEE